MIPLSRNQKAGSRATGNGSGIETLVQGGEAGLMPDGKSQKIEIGQIAGVRQRWKLALIAKRNGVWPKLMTRLQTQTA